MYGSNARSVLARSEDGEQSTRIEERFVENRQVYGSPRIHAELRAASAFAVDTSEWSASCSKCIGRRDAQEAHRDQKE
jgi:hypothetical protein